MITTVGQLAVNAALPPEMRDWSRTLDGPGVNALFQRIAEQAPEKYREIAKKLSDIGRDAAYTTGGFSFGLSHLSSVDEAKQFRHKLDTYIDQVMDTPGIDDAEKERRILAFASKESASLEKTIMDKSLAEGNPLALQIKSKARGNPTNLRSLRGTDVLYVDNRNKVIPVPITRSYSEGLSPAEYWAGTYGARKGVHDTKKCLSADTLVRMADMTVKRICAIEPGEYVLGADATGHAVPVRVLRRYDNGARECFRYLFRIGSTRKEFAELISTEDHKVLSEVRAGHGTYAYRSDYTAKLRPLAAARFQKNPTKNEFVACPVRGAIVGNTEEPLALLYGLLLGDGNCTTGWSLSCADQTLITDIQDVLQRAELTLAPPSQGYGWTIVQTAHYPFQRAPGGQITGTGHPALQRLTRLGVRHLAQEKQIAGEVDTWTNASVAQCIAGIMSADGCIAVRPSGVEIRLYMTSKHIVEWVKDTLATRFGVWGSALKYKPIVPGSAMRNPQWGFTIGHRECVLAFARHIPLVGVKQQALHTALPQFITRPENARIGFKIYSKEAVGATPTCDLEVDHPDHMFVLANGLIVSNSTADAGFFSKQLNQAAHRLVVTAEDSDDEDPDDEFVGLPVDVDDNDSVGGLLSHAVGGYARNTVITPKILQNLRAQGVKRILARSPIAGVGPRTGGVYARDVGHRDVYGRLPSKNDMVGLTASQALSEKLTQGQLSSKHSGGVAGASSNAAVSGFQYLNQLVQVPKTFRGGATHAQLDGKIGTIIPAPQGGNYVEVSGQRHYVGPEFAVTVEPGQTVEAGDVLSEGTPNPAEIAKHKHIGDGRRYFMTAFRNAYKDAGMAGHRRNIELLARGLVDHVEMSDEYDEYNPEDVVPYSDIARRWVPRETSQRLPTKQALGMYLEKPVLHHSIGTQIKPSMLKDLDDFGVKEITVNKEPPPFKPVMVRAMGQMNHDPDFMTRFLGSNLQKSMLDAVHTGGKSDLLGTSFVPSLAEGRSFGRPELAKRPKLF